MSKLPKYMIKVDDSYYTGEGQTIAIDHPRHTGWTGHQPAERTVLIYSHNKSDAMLIEGRRNLRSYIERILNDTETATVPVGKITIEKIKT